MDVDVVADAKKNYKKLTEPIQIWYHKDIGVFKPFSGSFTSGIVA